MPSSQPDLIAEYHDLLASGNLAAESQAHLDSETVTHGMMFGKRPVCSVLRPRFLTRAQHTVVRDATLSLLPAFVKTSQAALAQPEFRKQFHLRDWEESLLEIDPGFDPPFPTSRLDAFYSSDTDLKFTEYNTETPAGVGYHEVLSEVFARMPVVEQFARKHPLLPMRSRPGVLVALLHAYKQWAGGTSQKPRIAIVDWREVATYSEFVMMQAYFTSQGYDCQIVDPREIEYTPTGLVAGGYTFDLIYKRVLIGELVERGGIDHPIVRAVRERTVCMVNTFRCKILYKKASFAVMSDEANAHLYTPDELAAIHAHIPWTRVVEERITHHDNHPVDLVSHVLANRDRFALKPNDEYGGTGIVLGWTVNASEWDAAVHKALREPFVVQERINIPSEPYPSYANGTLHVLDRQLDTNPYVLTANTMHSCLTRISTEPLINVTAGGGSTVPTFLVE